jgi:putative transposase
MDFVHDQLATGRKLRVLTIIDTFSRFSRRSNLGLTSAALTLWRYSKKSAGKSNSRRQSGSIKAQNSSHAISICGLIGAVSRSTSRDRASHDNAFIESFNGKFRAECLNAHWFVSLDGKAQQRGPRMGSSPESQSLT